MPGTPHSFSDSQAAWNQGRFGFWPKYKTQYSMGYYGREDIPFQFALAEAFTICDAYHCSITSGTDPNRIVFWSGSNFDPESASAGVNCTDADSRTEQPALLDQRRAARTRLQLSGLGLQVADDP